jgi:hypothetical protein
MDNKKNLNSVTFTDLVFCCHFFLMLRKKKIINKENIKSSSDARSFGLGDSHYKFPKVKL